LEKNGKKHWKKHVFEAVELLTAAILPDYVVLGGGNVNELKSLPPACVPGSNANAFIGGFRMWEGPSDRSRKPDPAVHKASRASLKKKIASKKK
jgi:hypothetical protein